MTSYARLIETGNYYEGVFCTDCTIAHENGDISGAGETWSQVEFINACSDYDIVVDSDEIDEFSDSTCFGCMTRLAGVRYGVVAVLRSDLDYVVSLAKLTPVQEFPCPVPPISL
ncbi:hypothetical protein L5G28_16365 [Gordonia sp. HY285]|uniref:hypothetical protein n=1 Tax=Gordonia liuliyuniae TaxID=2911517 RepID=UPI001F295D06|nr:hypothetical protein [Gordonia liuliyuniae]MCF8611721.1 hypothetical protein [Gordonia liuliyuniae]